MSLFSPGPPIDLRLYRLGLLLLPPAFRREFADEMLNDAREALVDPDLIDHPGGSRSVGRRFVLDLARTIATQWWRTRIGQVAALALGMTLALVGALDQLWRRAQFPMPAIHRDLEVVMLVLLAAVLVVLIALTIFLTQWAAGPRMRPRKR